ncbi:MAG: hypothetical protein MUO73_06980 [Thermoplasmata archaeon]|nr:hypothetical protein [Thermoplasmata archaeon]
MKPLNNAQNFLSMVNKRMADNQYIVNKREEGQQRTFKCVVAVRNLTSISLQIMSGQLLSGEKGEENVMFVHMVWEQRRDFHAT